MGRDPPKQRSAVGKAQSSTIPAPPAIQLASGNAPQLVLEGSK